MNREIPLKVLFFETANGNQPVRDFIISLSRNDKKEVGADIFAVQEGFPIGLPLCRKLEKDIWEIRSTITDGICRILFSIDNDTMVLLHGFIKKTQKTPPDELKTARNRLAEYRRLQT